jgi:hypothetical protein
VIRFELHAKNNCTWPIIRVRRSFHATANVSKKLELDFYQTEGFLYIPFSFFLFFSSSLLPSFFYFFSTLFFFFLPSFLLLIRSCLPFSTRWLDANLRSRHCFLRLSHCAAAAQPLPLLPPSHGRDLLAADRRGYAIRPCG